MDMQDSIEPPHLSIVVPVFIEVTNFIPLVEAVRQAMAGGPSWELLMVDDGSTDGTDEFVRQEAGKDTRIRLIRLARNYGQTIAMQAGFDHSRGGVVVSMDGDMQNDPADIPLLVSALEEGDYDLVAGYRIARRDPPHRRIPSALANALVRAVTGVAVRDTGCSLRAYRRELISGLYLYSDLHRFLPAVAAAVRGARIAEIPVRHYPRQYGTSKYGLSRAPKVVTDLLVLTLIRSFRERPLLLFATGSLFAMVSAVIFAIPAGVALLSRTETLGIILPALPLVWIELGCYLLLLGLIAEVVLRGQWSNSRAMPVLVRPLS
jgi:glycosyltransferase involved in cell wall biosynthesis